MNALGQARRPSRIGFFFPRNDPMRSVFVSAMKDAGWMEGRDFLIVESGHPFGAQHVEEAARAMVKGEPDLIVTLGTSRALAAHRQTKAIPIVMWTSGYPVEVGLANSLARPGKNVTGNTFYAGTGVWAKMVELLREAKPDIKRIGVLWGYAPPAFLVEEIEPPKREILHAAGALGLSAQIVEYASAGAAFAAASAVGGTRPDAVILAGRGSLGSERQRVMRFLMEKRWLTIADSQWPMADEPYPLLAYGASFDVLMRQAAFYVDRILKGTAPGELPIQRPSKIDLIVSLKTATAIGLALPRSIVLRADRVIE